MKKVMLVRPSLPLRKDIYVRKDSLLNEFNNNSVGTIPLPIPPSIEGVGIVGVLPCTQKIKLSVDDILSLANELNAKDRKELLAKLSLASQNQGSEPSRDKDMWTEALYSEILQAFGHGGGVGQGPAQIKRCCAAGSAWASMTDFMEASGLQKLQVTQRYSVYKLLANLVVKQAKFVADRVQAPLSTKLIANCSQNVSGIFDAAFPGYLAAGLAPVVAKRLTQAR